MNRRSIWTFLLCLVVLSLLVGTSWGCEGCKNLSAAGGVRSTESVQAAFSFSVLFMLGVPLLLLLWLVRFMIRACQNADARNQPKQ